MVCIVIIHALLGLFHLLSEANSRSVGVILPPQRGEFTHGWGCFTSSARQIHALLGLFHALLGLFYYFTSSARSVTALSSMFCTVEYLLWLGSSGSRVARLEVAASRTCHPHIRSICSHARQAHTPKHRLALFCRQPLPCSASLQPHRIQPPCNPPPQCRRRAAAGWRG